MKTKLALATYLFLFCIRLFAGEFYSVRPHITTIKATSQKINSAKLNDISVERVLEGYVDFIIELYLLYPDCTRYHLARDGETAYDLDWLIWQHYRNSSTPVGESPELINISSNTFSDSNLKDYLKDKNVFNKNSKPGLLPVIFVDTGLDGTIHDAITKLLSSKKLSIRSHFVTSANPQIPSSRIATRTFFKSSRISESKKEDYLDAVDQFVYGVENFPHFTETSTSFEIDPATRDLEAFSEPDQTLDEKKEALKLMDIVKSYGNRKSTLKRVQLILSSLTPFMQSLKGSKPLNEKEVQKAYEFTKEMKWLTFWPDLRESFAKGNFVGSSDRLSELWNLIPGGIPTLNDLEDDELEVVESKEDQIYKSKKCIKPLKDEQPKRPKGKVK
jgi:hypothetical protein